MRRREGVVRKSRWKQVLDDVLLALTSLSVLMVGEATTVRF